MPNFWKYVATLCVLLFVACSAIVVDTHMPLASFRIPLTADIDIHVSVFDKSTGFSAMVFRNIKTLLALWKELPK